MLKNNKHLQKWAWIGAIYLAFGLLIKTEIITLTLKRPGWIFLIITIAVGSYRGDAEKGKKKKFSFLILACILLVSHFSDPIEKPKNDLGEQSGTREIAWQKTVRVAGNIPETTIVTRQGGPGYYKISYDGGAIHETLESEIKGRFYKLSGTNYDPKWKKLFPYSDKKGVFAMEPLFIVDGAVRKPKNKEPEGAMYQFPNRKTSIRLWIDEYITIIRHEAFWDDENGNPRNGYEENRGAWYFTIRKVAPVNPI